MSDERERGGETIRSRQLELPGGASAKVELIRRGNQIELHQSFQSTAGSQSGGGGQWHRCSEYGCVGEAIQPGSPCFAHASADLRQGYLSSVEPGNKPLNLRGINLNAQLWEEIKRSPAIAKGVRLPLYLSGAEISAQIQFDDVTLTHHIDLTGASLFAHMALRNCRLQSSLSARHAVFDGGAINCFGSQIDGILDVSYSETKRVTLGLAECTFNKKLDADGLVGTIQLDGSLVKGDLSLRHSRARVLAKHLQLGGALDISRAELDAFRGEGLIAKSATVIGPCTVNSLHLQKATFGARIQIDVVADNIDLTSASLQHGGLLHVDKAVLRLEQLRLGGPLRVSGKGELGTLPKVIGMVNADAGEMALARVNLAKCSFYGTHGLGRIDIETTAVFARLPWILGGRRFIADEYAWRSTYGGFFERRIWKLDGVHVGHEPPKPQKGVPMPVHVVPLQALQVAAIYRDLRRSLETKSDMAGAADFYYGEMEMRRLGPGTNFIEKWLVWCYWALAGYGLRPGRALLAWTAVVAVGTVAFLAYGAPDTETLEKALLASVRASIPGFATRATTTVTEFVEIALRVLGTVTVTMFVLSARSLARIFHEYRRPPEFEAVGG